MDKYYLTIVEWAGKKPPTAYYDRLRKLSLRIKRQAGEDQSMTAIMARLSAARAGNSDEDENSVPAVVLQEGTFLCASASRAAMIAALAAHHGCQSVFFGATSLSPFQISPLEQQMLERLEKVWSRRGRPKPDQSYVVICLDEMAVYQADSEVPVCPQCGSPLVRTHPGTVSTVAPIRGRTINIWLRSRFMTGRFTPHKIASEEGAVVPPRVSEVRYGDEPEQLLAEKIQHSKLADDLTHSRLTVDNQLFVLDALFVAHQTTSEQTRKTARFSLIGEYFQTGGKPHGITLAGGDEPDIFDISAVVPNARCIELIKGVY